VAAWGVIAAGVAGPLLRRRLKLPPPAVLGPAAIAPLAVCVVKPRSRGRDVAVCVLQMWAYINAYEMPNDDPDALAARTRVRYPLAIDRALGLGELPTVRLQRAFSKPGTVNRMERALALSHWVWFLTPHTTLAYILWRDPDRFPSAAARMYAVFDIGAVFYWTVPTAPPWWAAKHGYLEDRRVDVRRMMIEYGPVFWGDLWEPLYDFLGGNPLAAMPSLHFATSFMGAQLLSEVGPGAGLVGWSYALWLGLALVYLGEHYLIDLLAGAALTQTIRGAAPRMVPATRRLGGVLERLRALSAGG
jgi:membrane-associated phospholipid phosphatase